MSHTPTRTTSLRTPVIVNAWPVAAPGVSNDQPLGGMRTATMTNL